MNIKNPEKFIKENPIDNLNLEQVKQIYDKLVDDLNYHNYLYYIKSQPIISDYEYDILFSYLKKIEEKYPQIIRKDSPTQRLTNQVQSELKKAKHDYPLLSLENTYNPEEVEEKLTKLKKDYGAENFYIEPKYDGLSIELIYDNGYFVQAITRGDGYVGEDITENAKTINSLPLKINYKGKLHVRGEVIVRKSIFEKINKEREKKGLETYSNPRNLASGSLRQLDASITRERQLDVICYEILNLRGNENIENIDTHSKSLDFLENQGFFIYDFKTILSRNLDVQSNIKEYFLERKSLSKEKILDVVNSDKIKEILDLQDIEFDGLVIKVDDIDLWNKIGYTSHHPKWAFAFKYPAKQVSTKLIDVELSVGRTGVITPVAILDPVEIDGVVVKKSSLHNFDFIKEKDIHIQDYVFIQRSGEVIPYITSVIKERREKKDISNLDNLLNDYLKTLKQLDIDYDNSYLEYIKNYNLLSEKIIDNGYLVKIIEIPFCPVCGGDTFHPDEEVALKCINISCPAQIKEKLSYFVSKNGLDIEGLSEKTIELLLNVGLIKDFSDIFKLPEKRNELLSLPGFKEKKVENIIKSIENKKEINLDRFLQALGIEFLGKKTAKLIVDSLISTNIIDFFLKEDNVLDFQSLIDFLISKDGEEFLLSINGIGPKLIHSVKKFFNEKHNKELISKLFKYIKVKLNNIKKGKFSGKVFAVTGSIEGVSRDKIEKFIEDNGGEFLNQITQNISLLLVGDKPGNSKLKKAEKYNIKTYSLKKFLEENNFTFSNRKPSQESLF